MGNFFESASLSRSSVCCNVISTNICWMIFSSHLCTFFITFSNVILRRSTHEIWQKNGENLQACKFRVLIYCVRVVFVFILFSQCAQKGYTHTHTHTHTHAYIYTGCPRRNGQNFGRVFLMLNYTDITQNTYIQS